MLCLGSFKLGHDKPHLQALSQSSLSGAGCAFAFCCPFIAIPGIHQGLTTCLYCPISLLAHSTLGNNLLVLKLEERHPLFHFEKWGGLEQEKRKDDGLIPVFVLLVGKTKPFTKLLSESSNPQAWFSLKRHSLLFL